MKIIGSDIYIHKGDTADLLVTFDQTIENRSFYIFIKGIGKLNSTVHPEGEAVVFQFTEEHTDRKPRKYLYDMYMEEEGVVATIVGRGQFIVMPTARHESEKRDREETEGDCNESNEN